MLSIFSCAYWLSVCLLQRNVYLDLLPIFQFFFGFCFFLLSCVSCLYSIEIKLLLVTSFTNIFSHSVGCIFILFMVPFAIQKLVSLIRSHLFSFAFIFILLAHTSGKEPTCQCRLDVRDSGSITGSGKSPEWGHGNPL